MAEFSYIAVDKKGKTRSGSIAASDGKTARRKVLQSGLTILKIKMADEAENTSQSVTGSGKNQSQKSSLKEKYTNKGEKVGLYKPDLIVYDQVIVELKTVEKIGDYEKGQLLNYLKMTGLNVGVILNFKHPKLQWKRLVL